MAPEVAASRRLRDEGKLYMIDGHTFIAGLIVDRKSGRVIRAAPIVVRWVEGRTMDEVRALCQRKGWQLAAI